MKAKNIKIIDPWLMQPQQEMLMSKPSFLSLSFFPEQAVCWGEG